MRQPVLVGAVLATDLADTYGTPLYAYDVAIIRRRYRLLASAIPDHPVRVLYSCKANPAVGIVRLLRALGAGLDACSPGDLAVAAAAGHPPNEVSYVGFGTNDAELDTVAASGAFFTADSLSEIERYGQRRPGASIGLRINSGVAVGFHAHVQASARTAKFGLHPPQLADALRLTERYDLTVTGLHGHIGSDILDPEPHLDLLSLLVELSRQLPHLEFLNIGGGWGTPFAAGEAEYPLGDFGERAAQLLARAEGERGHAVALRVEPGAYLVMDSGVLLTSVTELKPPVPLGNDSTPWFACVDSSYNHVASAVLYDTHHPITLARRGNENENENELYHVVGNLMQAGDVLARDRLLPSNLRAGDLLVIEKCGGYSSSRATVFNERPRPAEVLVDSARVTMLRRRETVQDLLRLDV
jgi:diaminopimelate decarboxylase